MNLLIRSQFKMSNFFKRLQDNCFSSDVSEFHKVDCLEDSHDMMDHEKHEKFQVLDVLEDDSDDIQSLVVVKEDLLSCLLKIGAHFLKKCMIPLPWNQPMRNSFHF